MELLSWFSPTMVDGFINVFCMNHANNILAAIWFLAVIYILVYKTRLCIITFSSHIFSLVII